MILTVLFCERHIASGTSDFDEFKIKPEQVFEFTQKPTVTRKGDEITITFESKGLCDATVVIEEEGGKIVRHLASGVLGANAPEPFKKNSRKQTVVWDGKDDRGIYVDDKESITVRVSLGLKPRFERTFHWSPQKRMVGGRPIVAPAPEGVYVFQGGGCDHVRLFDHKGNYIRTVYPFPPNRSLPGAKSGPEALKAALSGVKGLKWMKYPQDGLWLPRLNGYMSSTFFTSGENAEGDKYGYAASSFAASPRGKTGARPLAIIGRCLNRLAGNGTTGGLPLEGPATTVPSFGRKSPKYVTPRSAVFSPDGRWLYMTGYRGGGISWFPGVMRLEYRADRKPELFAGSDKWGDEGSDNKHFKCPTSVACDSKGRVYVADSMNHRIQVFTPDGRHFKSINKVFKPVKIDVHPKTGDIYVASWMLMTRYEKKGRVKPVLTHYGPVEKPVKKASYPLEFAGHSEITTMNRKGGVQHDVTFDFHTDPPTLWMVPGVSGWSDKVMMLRVAFGGAKGGKWKDAHLRLYVEKNGKLVRTRSFADDVAKTVRRVDPPAAPSGNRQRMYVNPQNGKLYIAESDGEWVGKMFRRLLEVNPTTWKTRFVNLPFDMEEIGFDLDGLLYGRYANLLIARYDLKTMREVPFDYGEERVKPKITSAIPLPSKGLPAWFHQGGMAVSPKGHVVVSCFNGQKFEIKIPGAFSRKFEDGKPYTPTIYPGRYRWGEVHVWDKHGKMIYEDALPGLGVTDGLGLDKNDNIYALAGMNRFLDGKPYLLKNSATLFKVKAGKAKVVSSSKGLPLPIAKAAWPKRPFDCGSSGIGNGWIEGAKWMYGGVGFHPGGSCVCWNARFALDLLGRSFATELARFRVAILDTNGNLITRVGQYGNVDDGVPLIKDGGPANPRSVGGDEVALFHTSFLATHSDRRLYIADYGNYRILSVKLGYHAQELIALKDVKDEGK